MTAAVTPGQSAANRPVARLITASGTGAGSRAQMRAHMVMPTPMTRPMSAASSSSMSASSLERRAFDLINEQRISNGEQPFVWDAELCRMARMHSDNMARQEFFDHSGPDGHGMQERARNSNIRGWSVLAENIAYNQGFDDPAAFAVERWMRSSKHRDNILNDRFTRSAIGIARAEDGRVYLTQVFIAR
ncbi:MAG: CAP domain-containing protein [Acidobacteria bacterium]|nr:CAP domain-containing protein [Acidobacteriota bacterium]